jgi:endonuclease III
VTVADIPAVHRALGRAFATTRAPVIDLVAFGQTCCRPIRPHCAACPLRRHCASGCVRLMQTP